MTVAERNKLRFYKGEIKRLQDKLIKLDMPDRELVREMEMWRRKHAEVKRDAEITSIIVARQNKSIVGLKQVIADQAEQIYNLENGIKEIETPQGILQILFKGKRNK